MLVNCIRSITIVFFYSIFQTSAGFSYVGKVTILVWAGPFVDSVLLNLSWDFIFRCIRMDLRVLGF